MGEPQIREQRGADKVWTRDFVLICLANFFIFLGFQMTLPTIPLYVENLGGNNQLIGLVVGIFTFSALALRPFAGHALESRGRRFVFLTGLAIFVISVGSYGFLTTLTLLFAMRMVQGMGWGFSTTAAGTIATDLIPANRRGEGMGYFGLSGNLALAIGPTIGLSLVVLVPYSTLFLICALLGLASFTLASQIIFKQVKQDVKSKKKWDLFERSALVPSLLLFFITVSFGGIAAFLPLYTADEGITGINWYFLLYALSLMLTRTFAGKLYDRKGHKAVFIPGALSIMIAMLLLAGLASSTMLLVAALFYGTGFGMVQPALQAWAVKEAPLNRRGMANATFFSFFDLGVGIGAISFGFLSNLFGYSDIYLISALSIVMSIVLYLIILQKNRSIKIA